MTWCFQCGAESRPVVAVGYDADGDPACVGHQVRAKKPLQVEEVQTSAPVPTVDETEVAVHSFPPEYVSSPETPAQEEAMRARPAFAERKCACCGEGFIPTGATQRFAFGHKPKRVQSKTPRSKRNFVPRPAMDVVPTDLLSRVETQLDKAIPVVFAKVLQGMSLDRKLTLLESLLGF